MTLSINTKYEINIYIFLQQTVPLKDGGHVYSFYPYPEMKPKCLAHFYQSMK